MRRRSGPQNSSGMNKRINSYLWLSGGFVGVAIFLCIFTYHRTQFYGDPFPGAWGGPMHPAQGYIGGGIALIFAVIAFYTYLTSNQK
jgi:uncharacterized membrane protein